jgi:hypothetical protein
MPPAFNLSQDQTLQFDLDFILNGIEVNFTSFSVSVCNLSVSTKALAFAFKRPRLSAVVC